MAREAGHTTIVAVLAVLIPFASVITFFIAAYRWSEARRLYGGNDAAFATVLSVVGTIVWLLIFLLAFLLSPA